MKLLPWWQASRTKLNLIPAILWKNPVFVKEIRTRMRGRRAFILLSVYLLILGLITLGTYALLIMTPRNTLEQQKELSEVMFYIIVILEMLVVTFIAPAVCAGMISTERERQTFDLLRITLLPAHSLVVGKYLSAVLFLLLLLFASLPLQSPTILAGGVLPEKIWIATLIIAVSAVFFCALGLFFSSLFARTSIASVLSYALTIFLVFGIPLIALLLGAALNTRISAYLEGLTPDAYARWLFLGWLVISLSPLGTLFLTEFFLINQHTIWWVEVPLNQGLSSRLLSPWIVYSLISLVLSIALLWGSVQLVKRVEK